MVRLEQEVRSIENVHVELVQLAAVDEHFVQLEIRVVSTPEEKRARLMLPVVGRDFREAGDVLGVVGKDAELRVDKARPSQAFPVKAPIFGCEQRLYPLWHAADILVAGAFEVKPIG